MTINWLQKHESEHSEKVVHPECHYCFMRLVDKVRDLEARAELAEALANRYEKALGAISAIENKEVGGDWDEIEEARRIAKEALQGTGKK